MEQTYVSGMARNPDGPKVKNLHVELTPDFHTRLKVLVAIQNKSLKGYALEAIKEKVARDEAEMRK